MPRVTTAVLVYPLLAPVLGAGLAWSGAATFRMVDEQKTAYWRSARMKAYTRVAVWLEENAPPGAVVLVLEPGTIRYHLRRGDVVVVDLVGLNWKGDPTAACGPGCLVLVDGHRPGPMTSGGARFVPRARFPNLDGFKEFTMMERRSESRVGGGA